MTFDALLPIWLYAEVPDGGPIVESPFKFVGGFGYSEKEIGLVISLQGVYSMITNWFIVPWAKDRFGELRVFRAVAYSYFLLYIVAPYVAILPDNLLIFGLAALIMWKITFGTLAYPTNALLVAKSAPNKLLLGSINGVSASTASLCRAVGPTLTGVLNTAGLKAGYSGLPWWFSSLVCIVVAVVASRIPEPKEHVDEKVEEVEAVVPLPPVVAEGM